MIPAARISSSPDGAGNQNIYDETMQMGLEKKPETRDQVKGIIGRVCLWLGLAISIYLLGLAIDTLVDPGAMGPVPTSHRVDLYQR